MMAETDSLHNEPEQRRVLKSLINIDFSYIAETWPGRVKLLQLIFITLAGCILPTVINVFFTRFSFYTFVIWTSFMYIFLDITLHITSLWKRLPKALRMPDILMYFLLIGALALLISSCLVLNVADLFATPSRRARCGVSGAFGLIAMLLFVAEAALHYWGYRTESANDNDDDELENDLPTVWRGDITLPVSRDVEQPPSYSDANQSHNTATPVGGYGGD